MFAVNLPSQIGETAVLGSGEVAARYVTSIPLPHKGKHHLSPNLFRFEKVGPLSVTHIDEHDGVVTGAIDKNKDLIPALGIHNQIVIPLHHRLIADILGSSRYLGRVTQGGQLLSLRSGQRSAKGLIGIVSFGKEGSPQPAPPTHLALTACVLHPPAIPPGGELIVDDNLGVGGDDMTAGKGDLPQ